MSLSLVTNTVPTIYIAAVYSNRGDVLVKQRKGADAVQAYSKAIEMEPVPIAACQGLISRHEAIGRIDLVDGIVRELVRENAASAKSLHYCRYGILPGGAL